MTDLPIATPMSALTTSHPMASNPIGAIQARIDDLRSQTQFDVIDCWQKQLNQASAADVTAPLADLTEKRQIVWGKGKVPIVLTQTFRLPERLQAYPLQGLTARLALTWWAEQATVLVNGEVVQTGDLFDHSARVVLSRSVQPGELVEVTLHLTSPVHDQGALMRSRLIFESTYDQLDPGFVADELAVVLSYGQTQASTALTDLTLTDLTLTDLAAALARVDRLDLVGIRACLLPWGERIRSHRISLLGHAHLDMAWLWPVAETWVAAERTFASALQLQQDFPELIFCHTTPALYAWMEQHRPALFAQIQAQVAAGRWEALGGMWIEPELNLIDEESIVRQILYGQRYYQSKFGQISRIAWLPDTFGFCWQLPQLLKQGGMDYFVTQKLRWNDTTQYPHEVFNWRAPDGSTVLSWMTGPIGEGIDPVKLANYCWEWHDRTGGHKNPLWLTGVGDHGGGPTRDMLEIAQRWQQSPVFPQLEFMPAIDYLEQLERESIAPLPVHAADLYLEFHRGCYTTHADQKSFNRDCQTALYQAELWSSLATLLGLQPYPQAALETAWKQTLFNQFHDILPGTAIAQVFQEANPQWQAALQTARSLTQQAMQAIAQAICQPPPPVENAIPIVVFNSLGWPRSAVVRIAMHLPQPPSRPIAWQVIDGAGQTVTAYVEPDSKNYGNVWVEFPVAQVPACGYQRCWLVTVAAPVEMPEITDNYTIENEFLRLQVDPESGDIKQLWDKSNQRAVFADYANQIELFRDAGQYWDAWNIDPQYPTQPLPPSQHFDIVRMDSLLTQELWAGGQSGFRGYILEPGSPVLKIKIKLRGDERHVLQKATFPLNLTADYVTYDSAAGVIERPTRPQTEAEKAQWEVPGLRWADIGEAGYGVSILSDRKHGYDHKPNEIRLTLLRSPEWPDPDADQGVHRFSYAIYPHVGDWRAAKTVQKAREFSQPLQVWLPDVTKVLTIAETGVPPIGPTPTVPTPTVPTLPPQASLLNLGHDNLMLTALKQSEDDPEIFILRCYEAHGVMTTLELSSDMGWQLGDRLDLLERPIADQTRTIQPWQIASFALRRPH